jgi:uncharacterized coiled-coil protein SlyX
MMTHEQAEQKAAKLMDKLSGNGVVEWFSHGACLKEIAAALLDCQKDTEHKWPDIGQDPLQMEKRDSFEESFARLKSGLNKQQAGVPDQTALVWRVDISRVSDEVILQRARGESFMSTMERVKTLESEIASQKDAVKEVCEVLEPMFSELEDAIVLASDGCRQIDEDGAYGCDCCGMEVTEEGGHKSTCLAEKLLSISRFHSKLAALLNKYEIQNTRPEVLH